MSENSLPGSVPTQQAAAVEGRSKRQSAAVASGLHRTGLTGEVRLNRTSTAVTATDLQILMTRIGAEHVERRLKSKLNMRLNFLVRDCFSLISKIGTQPRGLLKVL
jgi:hypothetical protein